MGVVVIIGPTMTILTGIFNRTGPFRILPTLRCGSSRPPSGSSLVFIVTGLGGYPHLFIRAFGRVSGAAYAVVGVKAVLRWASLEDGRAGGIVFHCPGLLPPSVGTGRDGQEIGAFLMQVKYQATVVTTAMFMTLRRRPMPQSVPHRVRPDGEDLRRSLCSRGRRGVRV